MVFHDFRTGVCRRMGTFGVGVHRGNAGMAVKARAHVACSGAAAFSRSRQAAARTRYAVGVLLVLAVPDYLVRQLAGRNPLVFAAHARLVGRRGAGCRDSPFRAAVPVLAVATIETRSEQAGPGRRADFDHALCGSAVGDHAEL